MRAILLSLVALCAMAGQAYGFPEFQKFMEQRSGHNVDCAYCHAHPDGPEGNKPGQLGSLDQHEMEMLNRARLAFEPGTKVDSPILNDFGDHILFVTGKARFALLRLNPEGLAADLGEHDLDGDGIRDADEFIEGTHPLMASSGSPWRLLVHNAYAYRFHLVMLVLATFMGLFGLNHLLRWFGYEAQRVVTGDAATAAVAVRPSNVRVGVIGPVRVRRAALNPSKQAKTQANAARLASHQKKPISPTRGAELDERMDSKAVELVGLPDLSLPLGGDETTGESDVANGVHDDGRS